MLGIILNHLEALGQVVQSTAEVGLPSGLVSGEIIDFPTCYCPCLEKHVRFGSHGGKKFTLAAQKLLPGYDYT